MRFTFEALHLKKYKKIDDVSSLGIKNITRMRYNVYKIFFDINIPLK